MARYGGSIGNEKSAHYGRYCFYFSKRILKPAFKNS